MNIQRTNAPKSQGVFIDERLLWAHHKEHLATTWPELVCLANQHPKSTIKKKKPTNLCARGKFQKNVSPMFNNYTILLFFTVQNFHYYAPTAWSAFRSLFTWSRRTTCAKDHRLFYLHYPQINEVRKSDDIVRKSQQQLGVWSELVCMSNKIYRCLFIINQSNLYLIAVT